MQKKIPDVDVILDVLKQTLALNPSSTFINSLLQQYQARGSLSKKQLEGLHNKASKTDKISPGKLATIQAIILKKPTKYKSTISKAVEPAPDNTNQLIEDILQKYPEHKRVLFFKIKHAKNEPLIVAERAELVKFHKLLLG